MAIGIASVRDEHPQLVAALETLLSHLADLPPTIGSGVVDFRMTRRALERGRLLTTCVDLANTARHGPAYALMRTSLDHTFVDELIFRAERMNQLAEGVSDEWIEDMRTHIGDASGIEAVERRGKNAAVVTRQAHQLNDDQGNQVGWASPYWYAIMHHSPFLGPPSKQADISAVLSSEAERREWAKRNELTYRQMLSWGAIKKGLQLNGLRDEATCDRIDVHYRFLGGWAHSTEAALRSTRHGIVSEVPCHYCTELTVLYAVRLAAIELTNVIEHVVGRHPDRAERSRSFQSTQQHCWTGPSVHKCSHQVRLSLSRHRDNRRRCLLPLTCPADALSRIGDTRTLTRSDNSGLRIAARGRSRLPGTPDR